ncbi:MAG: hypothetical protein IPK77_16915 [Cellvibrio sp.]|nr:hypothetical protein [Cellvibrio sp.]
MQLQFQSRNRGKQLLRATLTVLLLNFVRQEPKLTAHIVLPTFAVLGFAAQKIPQNRNLKRRLAGVMWARIKLNARKDEKQKHKS